jgi:hypothetical protein
MGQLDCHCMDFDEIRYLGFLPENLWRKFQDLLKCDEDNGYFT